MAKVVILFRETHRGNLVVESQALDFNSVSEAEEAVKAFLANYQKAHELGSIKIYRFYSLS